MTVKLSLTAKSLLLVLVPLIFGVTFVIALVNLQRETEVEAQQAIKARTISTKVSNISSKIYEAWNLLKTKHNSLEEAQLAAEFFSVYISKFQPLMRSMASDYQELKDLTKDRPELARLVQQSASDLGEIIGFLDGAFEKMKSGDLEYVATKYRAGADKVVSLFENMARQNFEMVAQSEHDSAELSSKRHAATRQGIIVVLIVAFIFNLGFSILLAFFLRNDIMSRLKVMGDNARRLAINEPLNQLVGGHDEITELDKVFHGMASTIEETAKAKQELVSMLTHDLRSPLTAIQGSLELLELKANQASDEREQKLVDVAQRNSTRMMRLINDLLDIHKIKEGMMSFQPEEVCLAEVFEDVALSVSSWIEDNDIKLKYDDTDLFVYGEREKVERIIFNLVANAVKYSPNGGTINITARGEGRMVEVGIKDQGKGIPAEQQESIFERFQQVDGDEKASAGSGLGLTICQYLVRLQGGDIWVESGEGKGSSFYFTLPLG